MESDYGKPWWSIESQRFPTVGNHRIPCIGSHKIRLSEIIGSSGFRQKPTKNNLAGLVHLIIQWIKIKIIHSYSSLNWTCCRYVFNIKKYKQWNENKSKSSIRLSRSVYGNKYREILNSVTVLREYPIHKWLSDEILFFFVFGHHSSTFKTMEYKEVSLY